MNRAMPLAKRVIGYASQLSVRGDEHIAFAVSGDLAGEYDLSIHRLLGGGFEPTAPQLRTEVAAELGQFRLQSQPIATGSHGVAEIREGALGEFTIAVRVQPWMRGFAQSVVHLHGTSSVELGITADGKATFSVDAVTVTGAEVAVAEWTLMVASCSGTELTVSTGVTGAEWKQASAPRVGTGPLHVEGVVIGASSDGPMRRFFSGRIERPAVLAGLHAPDAVDALIGAPGDPVPAEALILYEFSEGIESWTVPGHGRLGTELVLHNAPKRAVGGSSWSGASDWRASPNEYGAIHFYPDALDDCGWEYQAEWTVPPEARSGFYAAHVSAGEHDDWIPFFVRPTVGSPTAAVVIVASSATYFAYANSRFWWEDPIQEIAQDRLVELGPEEQYLVHHPELGLSNYDLHADGTPVAFSSRLRPNLFMRPGHSRGESYACDLYLVSWFERMGIPYDVITDEDLHFDGGVLLEGYRVAVSGTHPEYLSIAMYDSTRAWVEGGGRYIYTGGNGFTSCVTWGSERPWLMENRTTGRMRVDGQRMHAEAVNQIDGTLGARMDESGRSPGSLWGVDTVTMGFDRSYPVIRQPASYAPEFGFAFAGIPGKLFGGRSLAGGGVIGQEWDNARLVAGSAGHHVLASSVDHSLIPTVLGADPIHHGDVVLYFHDRGVVFSASSMAWAGSLHIDNYHNDAETFMRNILNRFLDQEPIPQPDRATAGERQ